MKRKTIVVIMMMVLVGCLFFASMNQANAAPHKMGPTIMKLESIGNSKIDAFINDSRWTNGATYNSDTQPKLNSSAQWWGCAAYCYDYTYYCYGIANPRGGERFTDINSIIAGDVVTVGNQSDGTGHWFVVLKRSGNSLYVAEGNYNWKSVRIGWNYTISGSKFAEDSRTFTCGYHFYPSISDPTPSVTFSPWESTNGNTYIRETDASIGQRVEVSGGTWTEVGMILFNSAGDRLGKVSFTPTIGESRYYAMANEELHVTLTIDTEYKYQFFAVVSGQTFKSEVKSFRTKGYTIKYNANGGIGAPADQKKSEGKELTLSSTKPQKDGYDFQGWATSSNATSAQYSAGGKYTANSSVTLYAVWTKKQYTITFNANGGNGGPSTQTKTYGTDLVLSTSTPSRDGYDFKGWATSSNATSAQYSAGGKYTANAAVTLYAVWTKKQYTITFNANGGNGGPSTQTKTFGTDLVLSSDTPSRDGYNFNGWAKSSTAEYAQYSAGGTYTEDADATLYAVWTKKKYRVTYEMNGGAFGETEQEAALVILRCSFKIHGEDLALPTPIKEGYVFLGWSTSSNATSVQYAPGEKYTTNAAVTLYAVWRRTLQVVDSPYSLVVEVGNTATFAANAEGTGQLYYQWQYRKNSSDSWKESGQSGNKTAMLSVATTAGLHGYQFRCRITDNYGGEVYSNFATLSLVPKITTQPANKSVTAGTTAKFTVAATGKATLTYQWQYRKNSSDSWKVSGQSGNKTATLSVATTAGLHGYQFRCVVTDGNNKISYSNYATLSVLPKITTQPANKSAAVGTDAVFTVAAEGKETLTYQWQYRKNATDTWKTSGQSGNKTATLSVATTAGLHGYQFRCVVTDGNKQKSYSDFATLTVKPGITTQPVNKSVTAGSTAKFTVEATGKATLTYQWQYRKDSTSTWTSSGQSGNNTATLSVAATQNLNGYQFRCVVTDGNSQKSYSKTVTLSIIPKITTQPKNMSVSAGTTAKFTIAATGKEKLTYQWQYRKNSTAAWTNSGQSGNTTATLSVAATAGLHGYQFRCVVTDANGKKAYSSTATLSIVPAITSQPADKSVTAGTIAKFAVTATGKATLTYQWQYKSPTANTWTDSKQSGNTTATLSVNATEGLHGYQFRCVVTDGNNKKSYTSAATLSIVPKITSHPANQVVSAGTTATFKVTATGKATLTYQWQYKAPNATSWRNVETNAKTAKLTIKATSALNGYQYRCVVTDGNEMKAYSTAAMIAVQ